MKITEVEELKQIVYAISLIQDALDHYKLAKEELNKNFGRRKSKTIRSTSKK